MAARTKEERDALFGEAPVWKALSTMAVPAIVSQIINLVYSMADTFFVGRTGNPYMIAAVSLSFTLFLFNLPLSGLFGVGGGSHIARLIGVKDYDGVKVTSAFCLYASLGVTLLYSLCVMLFMDPLLRFLGASVDTIDFAKQYVWVVVVIGNIPTVLAAVFAHMLRNVGYAKQASIGLSGGGILNIFLDPLFMYVIMPDGYQVMGAAMATTVANTCSLAYFVYIFLKTQKETGLSLLPKDALLMKRSHISEIMKVGIPAAMTTLLMDFANMFLNASMAAHGDLELAALGIETKIERFSNAICIGITQSMMPLVAYNYARKNYQRMKQFLSATRIAGFCVAAVSILLYQLTGRFLVGVFISSKADAVGVAQTIAFGILFLRIRSIAAPFSMLNFVSSNAFSGMGAGKMALLQVFFRQILLYFPLLYTLDRFFGANGLAAAYPVSELLSGIISTLLLYWKCRSLEKA